MINTKYISFTVKVPLKMFKKTIVNIEGKTLSSENIVPGVKKKLGWLTAFFDFSKAEVVYF